MPPSLSREAKLWSLPVWGEWIEIIVQRGEELKIESLPVWGEWIEMSERQRMHPNEERLSPCGESGLKLTRPLAVPMAETVSPRVGRVD